MESNSNHKLWSATGPRGDYLYNTWYVAGWSDELSETPWARTFLDERVALFRDQHGAAHAIGGICPHRFASLGHGKVVDGTLQCPYHGLQFDSAGVCVFNPHENGVVPKVGVQVYPLQERHRLLWIWMGDPEQADASRIPDFSWLADPRWLAVRGTKVAEGHYELYSDNIMDLGHTNFVHSALQATSWSTGKRRFWQDGDEVWAEYDHPDDYLSVGISAILGVAGRKQDLWTTIRWNAPAVMFLDFRAGEPGTPRDELTGLPSLHAFTPETANTTHYIWAVARDFAHDNTELTQIKHEALQYAFEHEDMPTIRDTHHNMAGRRFDTLQPISLTGDAAGLRARRTLARLIHDERGGTDG